MLPGATITTQYVFAKLKFRGYYIRMSGRDIQDICVATLLKGDQHQVRFHGYKIPCTC